jgi:hypothetical protein
MVVRRRPLLRAAVVGGGAYAAGKRRAERSASEAEQRASQDQRISALEEQGGSQPAEQPSAGTAGGSGAIGDQLKQLSELHAQGMLSDEEFAAAKAKILGG